MKRVGIFSGTFDPVHRGHVQFAHDAIKWCSLDKVFFLVEPRPRRKQGVKAFEHRVNMVQLAIADEPKMGVIVLDQARFTPHETLPPLTARFKGAELSMLIGEDMLTHMAEWPHVEDLLKNVQFIIGVRGEHNDINHHIKEIEKVKGLEFHYSVFSTDLSDYSSSKARLSLRRGHKPRGLHADVAEYIAENKLYTSTGGAS
ncbi:MAG: nicotinate-nicotinamide nucleotide adenylyltransferase [Candidatus Saccharibacteria bacterium]|nr:nicotinate-nicotinamide nucleotide adenylyltransferase [Candidatus Saccharibacteria bacterium]